MLPSDVGGFHQLPSMRPLADLAREGLLNPEIFRATNQEKPPFVGGQADYLSTDGDKLTVESLRFIGNSDAYSFLSLVAKKMRQAQPDLRMNLAGVGSASIVSSRSAAFFRGTTFVRVTNAGANSKHSDAVIALARVLADRIEKDESGVPVLVKHLPDWETAQATAVYAVVPQPLKDELINQSVLDAVNFEGGTEAIAANYGQSQFVIVEFTTPQLASDNDRHIIEKIHELWNQGKPAPTAYRRVGNYSAFVFNAPDAQTANQLIDQVKYEQVVQWLGDNPHLLEEAQRRYTETTLGVLVSVVKASGLAALLCFGLGGLIGVLIFSRRRAQQTVQHAYSDAGGMMRLNLDEMTPESDPARLIGPGSR